MGPGVGPDPIAYPFDVPTASFEWTAGGCRPVPDGGGGDGGGQGSGGPGAARTAVLAIGSNAAPTQLSRKFGGPAFADPTRPDGVIPVLRADVDGIDVVHAAHVARYGSIPATPLSAPGAVAHVFVTWLTARQLTRMHETEALGTRHRLVRVDGVGAAGVGSAGAWCYASVAGVMTLDGRPVGLAAVDVTGSSLPRRTQPELWDAVAAASGLAPGGAELLAAVLAAPAQRGALAAWLAASARPDGMAGLAASARPDGMAGLSGAPATPGCRGSSPTRPR